MSKERGKNVYGRRGNNVSLAPLTTDEAVKAIFQISKEDAKRIIASKPTKKKPKK